MENANALGAAFLARQRHLRSFISSA